MTFYQHLDAGLSAILMILDLSAAFDTIDHDILLSRWGNVYGITGDALDWFRSYLSGKIQRVVIEDAVSGDQELGFGVPPGSVLGQKIYCMYTKPVSDIIQRRGLSYHSYADDTQLYMTIDHSNNNWRDGLVRIQLCVSEIREWMNQNMLKLKAPNDTAYKWWSCHSSFKLLCKLCRTSPPPAMGARFTVFLGMPVMRTRWMAGAAAHKSG